MGVSDVTLTQFATTLNRCFRLSSHPETNTHSSFPLPTHPHAASCPFPPGPSSPQHTHPHPHPHTHPPSCQYVTGVVDNDSAQLSG